MRFYKELFMCCVVLFTIEDFASARRRKSSIGKQRSRDCNKQTIDTDEPEEPSNDLDIDLERPEPTPQRNPVSKKRRSPPCATNQVCSHIERLYSPWGEVEGEEEARTFCRCGGRKRIRCPTEWDEYGDQSIYFMLPGDWTSGIQIRQAGLCDYNNQPRCGKGQKAATYRLHTATYQEEIDVHCACNNPLAPLLPMSHNNEGDVLVAEFKCNEYHRPPGDDAPWWGDKLYTGRR